MLMLKFNIKSSYLSCANIPALSTKVLHPGQGELSQVSVLYTTAQTQVMMIILMMILVMMMKEMMMKIMGMIVIWMTVMRMIVRMVRARSRMLQCSTPLQGCWR